MGGSPDMPESPDYIGAAKETAKGSIDAITAQNNANRVNQYNPYGSQQYIQDPNAKDANSGWSMVSQLSPQQQALLNQQNAMSMGSNALAMDQLGVLNQSMGNPGDTGYNAIMSRLQPQLDQSNKALQAQLANQGITAGSEAYDNAMRVQQQGNNDALTNAAMQGISTGQGIQSHNMNIYNALRGGGSVTNPTFGNTNTSGLAQSPDILGATQSQANYNQGLYNSQVAQNNAQNSSMMGLAGAGLGALGSYAGTAAGAASLAAML